MIDSGELIKTCRMFRRMSQKELSDASGVPKQTLSRVEQNTSCTTYTFVKLLNGMGFDIEIIPMADWRRNENIDTD